MKLWKRAAAFALCLGFSVSAFACGEKNSSSSENGLGSETTSSSSSSSGGGYVDVNKAQSVSDLLSTSNSGKIKIQIQSSNTGATGATTSNGEYTIAYSKTQRGVDAKIEFSGAGSPIRTVYVINGWTYTWDASNNTYILSEGNLYDALDAELAGMGLTSAQLGELFEMLIGGMDNESVSGVMGGSFEDYFAASAKLENGAMMITLDGTDFVNDAFAYLGAVEETTTLGSMVDDVLIEMGATQTSAEILEMISTLGTTVVSDAYEMLDDLCKQTTNYSINNFKRVLMMNESVISVLEEAGLTKSEIKEIENFDIEEYFTGDDSPYANLTVNEMIALFVESESEETTESVDYLGNVAMMAQLVLDMTLGEVETAFEMEGLVTTLQSLGSVIVDAAQFKYGVKYDKNLRIDSIIMQLNGKATNTADGLNSVSSVKTDIVMDSFSTNFITIELPEGAVVV